MEKSLSVSNSELTIMLLNIHNLDINVECFEVLNFKMVLTTETENADVNETTMRRKPNSLLVLFRFSIMSDL